MQGRRRLGRKEGDFVETLGLFRQLIQLVNTKFMTTVAQPHEPRRKPQPQPIQKRLPNPEPREQHKEQQRQVKVQRMHKIGLRSWRDWEGLCSQRKQDVLGEYAVCFEYSLVEDPPKIDNPQNGAQSQPFSNN